MSTNVRSSGQVILGWWRENLRPDTEGGAVRGFRARLRRVDQALDALAERRVIALHEALGGHAPADPLVLAALAQVLATVETNGPLRIARAFGAGAEPALSNLRFQRLIRIEDRRELASALRRALPLIGHTCNVAALGEDFLFWSEPVRVRWCFDYFKAPPVPGGQGPTDPELEETE